MKKQVKVVCTSCNGTGIYRGFAEHKEVGVVCDSCKGTGCVTISYTPFVKKARKKGVKKVFRKNQGYALTLESQGGIDYNDWFNGKEISILPTAFDKQHQCPAQYWQNNRSKYALKPDWFECIALGAFRDCKCFKNKHKCWEKHEQLYSKQLAKLK